MTVPREDGYFKPGNGYGGRKKGARNKLGEKFLHALHDDFDEHGEAAIARVRMEKPDQYLKVIAMILPKELKVSVDPMEELTDAELNNLIAQLSQHLAVEIRASEGAADQAEAAELQQAESVRTLQ